jgi:hypothetical protein
MTQFRVGDRVVSLSGEPATVTNVVAGEVMVRWDLDRSSDRVLYCEELFGLLDYPPTRHLVEDRGRRRPTA